MWMQLSAARQEIVDLLERCSQSTEEVSELNLESSQLKRELSDTIDEYKVLSYKCNTVSVLCYSLTSMIPQSFPNL